MLEKLYRVLLRLYPRDFRDSYGDELAEFFEDERNNPRYRHWPGGGVRFWVKTLSDLVPTAVRMRASGRKYSSRLRSENARRRIGFMDTLWQDIRYSLRGMLRQPMFSVVVVATLALGIGANVAIFSVINSVVLRPLPFDDPEGLVFVWEQNYLRDVETNVVSPANYFAWKEQNEVFSEIGVVMQASATITGDQGPERVGIVMLSPTLFSMLGPRAQLGRLFVSEDEQGQAASVVVLSHGFWQRRFGSDPEVVGRTIILNGTATEVVGVLPRDFDFAVPVVFNSTGSRDVWVPAQFDEISRNARGRYLQVLARLHPDISVEQAQTHMTTLAGRLEQEYPEFQSGWSVKVVPLHTQLVGDVTTPLLVLFGSVGFVLLIACANVANLLLARSTGRQREIAVRAALGAGRRRVVRQLLTESSILALAGGLAGILIAYAALHALIALGPQNLPRLDEIGIDYAVFGFALVLSLLTGASFGTLPALRTSALDVKEGLVEGGERSGTGLRHNRVRAGLVVAEFALSMMLLVGAGLLVRSFALLLDVDVGFDTSNVVTAQISLPERNYPGSQLRVQFFEDLVTRVQTLPGVTTASAITFMPLGGTGSATSFWVNDRPTPPGGEQPVADVRWVHRDFHSALGVPLVTGRLFQLDDTEDSPLSVIINETASRELWPAEDPIGKTVSMPWGDTLDAEVIGVVGDVRHDGPASETRAKVYWDHRQFSVFSQMTVFARGLSEPAILSNGIRRMVNELDRNLPVYNVRTVESYRSEILAQDRFTMLALGLFAAVALLLASVGIYGVMSYTVSEQTRQIGIKLALGARASTVTLQTLRNSAFLIGVAVLLGGAGSFALSRLMSGMVFGIGTSDPMTLSAVLAILLAVALLASYLPARRASMVDPMTAMRQE